MLGNLILRTDSYKASHFAQFPPGVRGMYSYLESRGGAYDRTVFFGLQYLLTEYLSHGVSDADCREAAQFFRAHGLPFNYDGWQKIALHRGGKLPVRIRAIPEGTVVPTGNVLLTVESTDPETFWLVSWLETMIVRLWYPITVATVSWHAKRSILKFLTATSDDPAAEIGFKLHDFGARGVSSAESAAIGGAAHLVNFMGSDTVEGVLLANRLYNGGAMSGFSIPAAEHSTITAWGREGEADAYRNMITQFGKPGALVAVVSDSYDIYAACSALWGRDLKQAVIDSGATVVIRPDSGDPQEVVVRCLELLATGYGFVVNTKGYKVLNHVRVIQGDGVSEHEIKRILERVTGAGWSATNVAFGMGGGLLQKMDRDTQRFAFKCSSVTLADGTERDVFKAPIGEAYKASKRGRLALVRSSKFGGFETVPTGRDGHADDVLRTVFEDGEIVETETFDAVRRRANDALAE